MFKIIYKNKGKSSFQCIKEWQKKNNVKKIGHTGTLDPMAQGLLLIATDDDTKLIQYLKNKDKEYHVKFKLGEISSTYDSEGQIQFFSELIPNKEEIEKCIMSFQGKIEQVPPKFSAKKINGKKAYDLARQNKNFILKPVKVEIKKIWDISYDYPYAEFKTLVSNGTYIRSLVNDIGIKIKTGSYMTFLERTMINGLTSQNKEIKPEELIDFKKININTEQLISIYQGKKILLKQKDGEHFLIYKNEIVGIVNIKNNKIQKVKLFGSKIKTYLFNKNFYKGDSYE